MLTLPQALAAIALQQNNTVITPDGVADLLQDVHGTTFAEIVQVTPVATAAAHRDTVITKVTVANVQLFNNLRAFTNAYTLAVKRSAAKLGISAPANIQDFESQGNYFEHTSECYSVVQHKAKRDRYYLFAIYNDADSVYVIGNTLATKQQVAQYLTPSAARELLSPEATVHNVSQDVTHNVRVRTVSLDNVVGIAAKGYELNV